MLAKLLRLRRSYPGETISSWANAGVWPPDDCDAETFRKFTIARGLRLIRDTAKTRGVTETEVIAGINDKMQSAQ